MTNTAHTPEFTRDELCHVAEVHQDRNAALTARVAELTPLVERVAQLEAALRDIADYPEVAHMTGTGGHAVMEMTAIARAALAKGVA